MFGSFRSYRSLIRLQKFMKIFFSVGEPSGDLHAANLVQVMRDRWPQVETVGFGGPRMAAAGCQLELDLSQHALMGFLPVIGKLPMFYRFIKQAERYFIEHRPDAVVLVDYPGFNWWIARKARKHGIPVFYYGVPQIWAWARWRVRKLRRLVDHVLCKLPFEVDWYSQRGCHASHVGHPYFDELATRQLDQQFIQNLQSDGQPLVAILPGSRRQEVAAQLPVFLKSARLVKQQCPETRFAVASFNDKQAEMARQMVLDSGLEVEVYVGRTGELIEAANSTLACSGSVSLELMYHQTPSVILYKVKLMSYLLSRLLVRVRYMTLVNLMAGERRFDWFWRDYDPSNMDDAEVPLPEYPCLRDKSTEMSEHLIEWLQNPASHQQVSSWLGELKTHYARPGASKRAAEYIGDVLGICSTSTSDRAA